MNYLYERKTLKQTMQFLEKPKRFKQQTRRFVVVFHMIAAVLFITAIVLAELGVWPASWCVVVGLLGGMFAGGASAARISAMTWIAVSPHIDKTSVANRLLETET